MKDNYQLLARETAYKADKGTIDVATVKTVHEDGRERILCEPIWADRDSIGVLPYDPDTKMVLLVRQMRSAVYLCNNGTIVEACAGGIEKTDTSVEVACRREAQEELGVKLGAIELVAQVFINPARMTEKAHLFLATYQSGSQKPEERIQDEDEDIEVIEMPFSMLEQWYKDNLIECPRLLMLTQALLLKM